MQWAAILAHYRQLFDAHGCTQAEVATRGGLTQPEISRILKNTRLGPSVETFAQAVEGLGMTLSAFFADLDAAAAAAQDHDTAPRSAASSPGKTRTRLTPRQKEREHAAAVVLSDPAPHLLELQQAFIRLQAEFIAHTRQSLDATSHQDGDLSEETPKPRAAGARARRRVR